MEENFSSLYEETTKEKPHRMFEAVTRKKGAWCDMLTEKTRKETWRQTWGIT